MVTLCANGKGTPSLESRLVRAKLPRPAASVGTGSSPQGRDSPDLFSLEALHDPIDASDQYRIGRLERRPLLIWLISSAREFATSSQQLWCATGKACGDQARDKAALGYSQIVMNSEPDSTKTPTLAAIRPDSMPVANYVALAKLRCRFVARHANLVRIPGSAWQTFQFSHILTTVQRNGLGFIHNAVNLYLCTRYPEIR
jgi:hypothetical protein